MTEREGDPNRSTTTRQPPPGLLLYRIMLLVGALGITVGAATELRGLMNGAIVVAAIAGVWLVVRDASRSALVEWDRERGDLAP